jgi:hypothetical protein
MGFGFFGMGREPLEENIIYQGESYTILSIFPETALFEPPLGESSSFKLIGIDLQVARVHWLDCKDSDAADQEYLPVFKVIEQDELVLDAVGVSFGFQWMDFHPLPYIPDSDRDVVFSALPVINGVTPHAEGQDGKRYSNSDLHLGTYSSINQRIGFTGALLLCSGLIKDLLTCETTGVEDFYEGYDDFWNFKKAVGLTFDNGHLIGAVDKSDVVAEVRRRKSQILRIVAELRRRKDRDKLYEVEEVWPYTDIEISDLIADKRASLESYLDSGGFADISFYHSWTNGRTSASVRSWSAPAYAGGIRQSIEAQIDGEQYDSDGFDAEGFNKDGVHKNGTRYDDDGFGCDGYGYSGRNLLLFNQAQTLGKPTDEYKERDRDGYDRGGYNMDGYDKRGYDRDGFNRWGFNCEHIHRNGTRYNDDGFDVDGYDCDGFSRDESLAFFGNPEDMEWWVSVQGPAVNWSRDREGYDRKGYDRRGFNREHIHRNCTAFNNDGYDYYGHDSNGLNRFGRRRDECDEDGYDGQGFDSWGWHRNGTRYGDDSFDIQNVDRDGYGRDGHNSKGFNREGFYRNGTRRDQYGYDHKGFDADGYDREDRDENYNEKVLNEAAITLGYAGYDDLYSRKNEETRETFDRLVGELFEQGAFVFNGFDKNGNHKSGTRFDYDGYDCRGFDIDGYNRWGYDKRGFDKKGAWDGSSRFDEDGYDVDGYSRQGYDKRGFDKNGAYCDSSRFFNEDGYDVDGYDKRDFNIEGIHRNGHIYDDDGYGVDGSLVAVVPFEGQLQMGFK